MNDAETRDKLRAIRDRVQEDVGGRGLARIPEDNLLTAFPEDFEAACRSLAETPDALLEVVTGFWIPTAEMGETDGPLGAVWLARTLPSLGIRVRLRSDPFCLSALEAGLRAAGVPGEVLCLTATDRPCTHRLALERVGPSHTPESLRDQGADEETVRRFSREVPLEHHNRCHTMRGRDITTFMLDTGRLFENRPASGPITIGIGDGGNEIGMGKVRWETIAANIPGGATVACRVATDWLIVAGISNWGAYALGAGVAVLKGTRPEETWFDPEREKAILAEMVARGPLVDGVSGKQTTSVDGLEFAAYAEPLRRIGQIVRG